MANIAVFLFLVVIFTKAALSQRELPVLDTVPELIRYWGYPVEEHSVTTEDGYILGVHRIPHGKFNEISEEGKSAKGPVFLAHGLLSSSSQWAFGPPEKSLAYILADAGYDVWMGNTRGNAYSHNHVMYEPCPSCREFWDFGFDDSGVYDYSAVIDHILQVTGEEKLHFVGHSMGCTQYLVLLSEKPEYNDKIIQGYLLAPAGFMTSANHPIFTLAEIAGSLEDLLHLLGIYEFLPHPDILTWLGHQLCDPSTNPDLIEVCDNIAFGFLGLNPAQFNESMIPIYLDQLPAGTSTRPFAQYAQFHFYDYEFRKYDFGNEQVNLQHYGLPKPPEYTLENIKTPLAIWSGNKDYLADMNDIEHLLERLPNVVHYEVVPIDGFTHLDFAIAIDADSALYAKIVAMMDNSLEIS